MLIDYHIHTSYSGDGKGKLADYVPSALNNGLNEIGFSDHYNINKSEVSMDDEKLKKYVTKVTDLRRKSNFKIKLGIEVDFIPGLECKIKKKLAGISLDYIIGSVHFINDWGFDNPKNISKYQNWNINELFKVYYRLLQKSAKSGLFNIIGHFDLIKKFNYKANKDLTGILKETIKVFKENNLCVEINTNGLNFPCKEIYPNKKLLKLCFEEGVPITLGSDAHRPGDVGKYFNQALNLIKEVGYKKIAEFTRLKRELVSIN